jgi:Ca2+-binding EF-hand superfamily protein
MDTNLDDRIAKSEVRGRMATMLLANWDKADTNTDGYLVESEMAAISQMMGRRISQAQAQQSVGQ